MFKLILGDIEIDVVLKDIKNVHLSVHPPNGRVRVAAPTRMKVENVRLYVISKLDWIKKQQRQLREQKRETQRDCVERESHYVWGKRYLLKVIEHDGPPQIEVKNRQLLMFVRESTSDKTRNAILEKWYREQVKQETILLIDKWQAIMNVKVKGFYVRRMKTRWGSCNTDAHTIRINSELAKKNLDCLEYIVVHELAHMIERSHSETFRRLLDKFYPRWVDVRSELNDMPLGHFDWAC